MTKTMLTGLGLVLVASCAREEAPETEATRANSAIQALTARDEARVAQCNNAVEACNERLPDAASDGVCARLAAHCDEVNARLAEVRDPVVGCWRAVQECAEHTPERAQCRRDAAECEALGSDADEERSRVVDCSARVETCLERAANLPEQAAVACENMAAACENAAAHGNGGDSGAPSDDDDIESGDDAESGDDDGATDAGAGQSNGEGRGRGERPIAPPPGRGRPADAGSPRR